MNDEQIIKKEIIKKSFLIKGIAQKTDGTEDDIFIWPEEIEHEITIDNINEYPKCEDSSDDYLTD